MSAASSPLPPSSSDIPLSISLPPLSSIVPDSFVYRRRRLQQYDPLARPTLSQALDPKDYASHHSRSRSVPTDATTAGISPGRLPEDEARGYHIGLSAGPKLSARTSHNPWRILHRGAHGVPKTRGVIETIQSSTYGMMLLPTGEPIS
jgi:hypothetical protein